MCDLYGRNNFLQNTYMRNLSNWRFDLSCLTNLFNFWHAWLRNWGNMFQKSELKGLTVKRNRTPTLYLVWEKYCKPLNSVYPLSSPTISAFFCSLQKLPSLDANDTAALESSTVAYPPNVRLKNALVCVWFCDENLAVKKRNQRTILSIFFALLLQTANLHFQ